MSHDIDYYELFGVDKAEESRTGEKEQEVAEPAMGEDEARRGEKEQEVAEAAVEESAPKAADEKKETEKEKQGADENAKYAALRREAEKTAKRQFEKDRDHDIAALNITDEDGRKIETYDAFVKHFAQKRESEARADEKDLFERLIEAGFTESEAKAMSSVRRNTDRLAALERDLAAMKEKEDKERFTRKVAEELEIIASYDPNIKSIDDFAKMENFDAFREYIREGESYLSAYLRANREQIKKARVQSLQERPAEKDHLSQTKTRGNGAIDVPESVIAAYRVFNPTATRAEIIAHYRKNHKQ